MSEGFNPQVAAFEGGLDGPRRARYDALCRALSEQGVRFRVDSNLCKCYVMGALDESHTAQSVARSVAVHKFLYEHTTYPSLCSSHIYPMVQRLSGPLGSWDAAWRFVESYEAPLMKGMAVQLEGGIPEVWPWLCSG